MAHDSGERLGQIFMSNGGSNTAQEALLLAMAADAKADKSLDKHDDHEKICAERYQGIRDDFQELKGEINKVTGGLFKAGGFVLITLVSALGFLLADKFF